MRHLVALQRQWQQSRRIDFGEGAGAAAGQFLECLRVEACEQRCDGVVDLMHAAKLLVAQTHHDPAFDDLHCGLCLGLVLGVPWPCRQNRGAVVTREVEHGIVAARLIPVGVCNHRLGIVGDDELRHATDVAERCRR